MTMPRIMIAGTHSGAGKTTVATGIMAALRRRGFRVQGFKTGPDFIDPTFHESATGRPSRNLDGWMLSRDRNLDVFARATADADVAVIEGVMGMFDAKDGSLAGSTAEMAMWVEAAIVLVVDASAMAASAAALVHGFDTFEPELRLAAVVLNRIASPRHYELVSQAISSRCRPELIGYVPREAGLSIPERHLGLHLAEEALPEDKLRALADCVEKHIDLDRLLAIGARPKTGVAAPEQIRPVRARIGIARDRAFCFYYEDNLDLLRALGAELVPFSPARDGMLPADLDGLYLGGGYPELALPALSENVSMRTDVAQFVETGFPVYAECGGLMYLTEAIVDAEGNAWPMAAIFPTRARMQRRLARLGYVEIETCDEGGWGGRGLRARGHEFRYSVIDPMPDSVTRAYVEPAAAYRVKATLASYVHLHFGSCPQFARSFVESCARRRAEKFQALAPAGESRGAEHS